MPMKKSSALTVRFCLRLRRLTAPPSVDQRKRQLGARVGMGDRAADRAARPGLHMAEPGQAAARSGRSRERFGQASSSACRTPAPTVISSPDVSIRRRPASRMMSTSTAGRASRMLSIGTSDWPPAMTRASPPPSAQRGKRLLQRLRAEEIEGCGLHLRLLNRRRKPLSEAGVGAGRPSAAGMTGERAEELSDHHARRAVEQSPADRGDLAADRGLVSCRR